MGVRTNTRGGKGLSAERPLHRLVRGQGRPAGWRECCLCPRGPRCTTLYSCNVLKYAVRTSMGSFTAATLPPVGQVAMQTNFTCVLYTAVICTLDLCYCSSKDIPVSSNLDCWHLDSITS